MGAALGLGSALIQRRERRRRGLSAATSVAHEREDQERESGIGFLLLISPSEEERECGIGKGKMRLREGGGREITFRRRCAVHLFSSSNIATITTTWNLEGRKIAMVLHRRQQPLSRVHRSTIKRDEMADRAGEKVQHGAENAGGFLQQTGEQVKHMAQVVAETAKNAVGLGGSDAAAASKNLPELIGSDSGNTMNAAGFGNAGSTATTHTTTTKR
ncbi:hypothetical protein KSP39_PZI024220 [Platanthera zijinensis]|uniref:Uncharacterized protein n=1 Tax=Platanthera zijinensis TaxID=2320716 RepID=A0AAP0FU28_9ASPA